MRIIVAACSSVNRAMGLGGKLPWSCVADRHLLRAGMASTLPCYCGQVTFDGMPPALQKRSTVLHRTDPIPKEGIFLGGQALFECLIEQDWWDRMYLTLIHGRHRGDRFFPPVPRFFFKQSIPFEGCTLTYMERTYR